MKKYKTIILMCIFTTLGMIIGRYTSKNDVYEQDTIKRKNNNRTKNINNKKNKKK